MRVKQDPITKLWCREDGAVCKPPSSSRLRYYWTLGHQSGRLGYLVVWHHGKRHRVHRIVARAFLPNPGDLPTVDHADRNPKNNSVGNLRWADYKTQAENHGRVINRVDYGVREREDRKAYAKAYGAAHHEDKRAYNAAYYAAHREDLKAYSKAHIKDYRTTHRAAANAYAKAYAAAQKAKGLVRRKCSDGKRRYVPKAVGPAICGDR